jgi:hypothetical protein
VHADQRQFATELLGKKEVTFLKKSNQKTFANWPPGGSTSAVQDQKFFGYFFEKK